VVNLFPEIRVNILEQVLRSDAIKFVSLYDFGLNRRQRLLLTVAEFSSLISAISKQFFEERVSSE
jgi:hypothetical protein